MKELNTWKLSTLDKNIEQLFAEDEVYIVE